MIKDSDNNGDDETFLKFSIKSEGNIKVLIHQNQTPRCIRQLNEFD